VANAQQLAIQFGSVFPSGSFGNTDVSKVESGFAKSGYSVGLHLNYPVYKNMGVSAMLNHNVLGVNQNAYQTQLNANPATGTKVSVKSEGDYTATATLIGAFMTLGKKKLTAELRLMSGFVSLTNKGLSYTTSYAGQEYTQSGFSQTDFSIAFSWGTTVKYLITDKIFAAVNLDNTYAPTKFDRNTYQSSANETISKPFQTYCLSIGVGYSIK
jgi:hypothetical protein